MERKDPPRFIYVTDTGNHMLRRIDLLDTNVGVETIAGSPDGTAGFAMSLPVCCIFCWLM